MEQRRQFAGLKEGAHIPGYQGYCPQLKYSIGKSFGQETSDLAQIRRCRRHQLMTQSDAEESTSRAGLASSSLIPESTGDNKYTQNMVPGYTGYVPRWPFKFGKTYKEECDICLEEFLGSCHQTNQLANETRVLSVSQPSLRAISSDPAVRDKLNGYGDRKFTTSAGVIAEHRRLPTEAPIPGYRGYVPRINVTELGLGSRYHETTHNGLNSFFTELEERSRRLGTNRSTFGAQRLEPINVNRNPVSSLRTGSRIYIQDGMIPKYTGFLPQQRYATGNTYGDETRSLEVCAHDQSSYGEYVKKQEILPQ
jgi:hypothetical protein